MCPSAIFDGIEMLALLIWLTSPNTLVIGKFSVTKYTVLTISIPRCQITRSLNSLTFPIPFSLNISLVYK